MSIAIGIDLGTTFSAVSYIESSGKPVILKNSIGESTTPSVIYFKNNGTIIIGDEAKEMQEFGEQNVASFFKRNMGDSNFGLNFNNKVYSATELSTILLRHLKEEAEKKLGKAIDKAVITVPAYFNDLQREATIEAAKNAGLEVLRIINEPTAAALNYGLKTDKNQKILVYDLGGGTFDVTILEIKKDAISVIATGGDHELGGKDWDNRLLGYFASQFEEEFGVDPLEDALAFNDLLVKGEEAKKQLSSAQKTQFTLVFGTDKGRYELIRDKFNELTFDLLQKTKSKAEEVLQEAGLRWNDLDGILLVGGSTRMPMVKDWVREISGKEPIPGINPDEEVCLGAGIQAKLELEKITGKASYFLGGRVKKIEDVMSHSLGLIAENQDRSKYINSILIPKNKTIPVIETRPYQLRTGRNRNNELEVYLTQGESEDLRMCTVIGKYVFSEIEHLPGGNTIIDIEYQYDDNGKVQVSAKQRENNKALKKEQQELPADMSWIFEPPVKEELVNAHLSIVIAIDISGSMSGRPLAEAQKAAKSLIDKLDMANTSVALMPFANKVMVNQPLTQKSKKLIKGIDNWIEIMNKGTVGYGNSTHPFNKALEVLQNEEDPRFIIVLADGVWSRQNIAIEAAKKCAEEGIEIIAIGFGGADRNFLRAIATSDENALFTDLSKLVSSFSKIGQVLSQNSGQLGQSEGKKKGFLGFFK